MRRLALAAFAAAGVMAANTPALAAGSKPASPPPVMPMKPADAVVLKDGLAYKILKPGVGETHPKLTDNVTANYSLWKADGTFLESTCDVATGKCEPATFPLAKLIPGWQEIVPMMVKGEKLRVWLTSDLSYGDPPRKPNRPAGPLVFEIELVDIGRPLPPEKP